VLWRNLQFVCSTLKLETKLWCYKKIAGITVFSTVFRYDRVVMVLLLKVVNPRLGICSAGCIKMQLPGHWNKIHQLYPVSI
jgi:hypothetical protein